MRMIDPIMIRGEQYRIKFTTQNDEIFESPALFVGKLQGEPVFRFPGTMITIGKTTSGLYGLKVKELSIIPTL